MTIAIDTDTETFARRLARLRGETVEQAVRAAVRTELARTERTTDEALTPAQQAKVKRTMEMVAALPRLPLEGNDPTAFLYDEYGLPH